MSLLATILAMSQPPPGQPAVPIWIQIAPMVFIFSMVFILILFFAVRKKKPEAMVSVTGVFKMQGSDSVLEVFENKVEITASGLWGVMFKGLKGTKSINYHSISAIQLKAAGFTSGYIQFTLSGGNENSGGLFGAIGDENTFMFRGESGNDQALKIKDYIEKRINDLRSGSKSAVVGGGLASELQKLADMKASGLIDEAEFVTAKKRVLGG